MLNHFPQAVPEIPVSNVEKAAEYYASVAVDKRPSVLTGVIP